MTDRYAVMGNPIAHSKSPDIHRIFAKQTGQDLEYTAILVEPGKFAEAVDSFRQNQGKGLNITVPFKREAWILADRCTPRAERAGAVNTLILLDDGTCEGDNTDGIGLVRDLIGNLGIELKGTRILLAGAGGAARGVLQPLLEREPTMIQIANRTASRAVELASSFSDLGHVSGCGFDKLDDQSFDIIINATAAGLQGEMPPLPESVVRRDTWCYDMMYGNEPTAFLNWAADRGVENAVDGLGMLVEQAGESFYLWRGVRPDTGDTIRQLRTIIASN